VRLPPAACRLPPAACRLPPAACRLPPAACRLPPAAIVHLLISWHFRTFPCRQAGEIDDVVQAAPEDKARAPGGWRGWRFECVLAVDDPTVSDGTGDGAAGAAARAAEPCFAHTQAAAADEAPAAGAAWRCGACYATRFRTM
jgi:hypothetical protein